MPPRLTAARELSDIFKVIGRPDRVRIIEQLRHGGHNGYHRTGPGIAQRTSVGISCIERRGPASLSVNAEQARVLRS